MANRRLNQFRYSFEQNVVECFAKITIGGTGACTLTIGKGIESVSRTSPGLYVIKLQDTYNKLLDVSQSIISGSSAAAAPMFNVVSESVATQATRAVTVQYRAIDNSTATGPASGEVLLIRIALRNSSI